MIANNDSRRTRVKYGLYGKLQAQPGQRDALAEILLRAARMMEDAPGCILYVVSTSPDDPDGVYVMELWDSKDDHDRSLQLPGVRELIAQAMPILGGPPQGTTLDVLGGRGLPRDDSLRSA
jgi:quinol monooxygenase YgiN